MNKIKVLSVFGTRPEAIKMAPIVEELKRRNDIFDSKVLITAQHREMLDQVLEIFDIKSDYDLNIMKKNQSLSDITVNVLEGVNEILKNYKPDILLVHGDTTTTFAASLSAFYNKVKVGHVEAGLRSGNKFSPYPEEINRILTDKICDIYFAPTEGNRDNLIKENIDSEKIYITGNTIIDALFEVVDTNYKFEEEELKNINLINKRLILLTAHRRENLGKPMRDIFKAVKRIVEEFEDIVVIYPIHMNQKVREVANEVLSGVDRIFLIEPLGYKSFANLLLKADLVLTDSGGIQEEAPALGKPVLVLRKETERPEAVVAGTVKVVGVSEEEIYIKIKELIINETEYFKMANSVNPYGDGFSAKKIVNILENL